MPVRKLKKSYRNVTGMYYSSRLHRLVQFDSILERDFIQILDIHPSVRSFAEQPMKIAFFDADGLERVYVPDFHVTFSGGQFLGRHVGRPWIIEIKCRHDLETNWRQIALKLRAGVRVALNNQFTFHVLTESVLAGAQLANAKFLRRFANSEPSAEVTRMILAQVRRPGGVTIGQIRSASPIHRYSHLIDQALWIALARGIVCADMEAPFSPETRLWMP